ncbi:MAG: carboxypeptidase-like regulatory domain-containing protein [Candidatus Micrarchaeota archaeon]|nr:carboxypeptidase-like regulatory domain-containing protein [Candidatus Micrarchaeota archaeon]
MAAAFAASVSISSAALVGCECGTLSKANSVCTLTGDLAAKGTCFTVAASNVTINCNGFTITGPEGTTKAAQYGVYSDKDYTKVLNCRISRFSSAVYFHKASYGLIQNTSGNTTAKPADKQGNAIVLGSGASYNTITNVTASSKYGFGLFMDFGGNYNNVSNVNLAGPSDGLSMSIRADHTALNGIYSPGWAQIAGTYNTLADSKLATLNLDSMKSQQYNLYNVIYGNTFYVNAPGVAALNIYSGKNTLYWNNISNPSGSYVDDHSAGSDCQNYWNTTINGKPEGNLWGNVLNGSAVVTGNASSGYPSMALYIGNNGSSDPYSNTTSLGKISGPAVDYAPLTPLASRHVSGTVAYYNALNSSMQNVTVYLKQGGVTKYAATTGGSGFYNLPSVAQGTYDVYFSLPMAPGSINSGDAANAQGCSMNISQPWCYGITLLAMDVYQNSPSTIITSDDGSAIQQYYMYGGNWQNSPPPPGNFVFTPSQYATVNYSAFPIPFAAGSSTAGYSGVTMTVGATDVTQNFVSLCYGDADRSFMIPPASTRAVSGAITYGLSENQMHWSQARSARRMHRTYIGSLAIMAVPPN